MTPSSVSRRRFLKGAALAGIATGLSVPTVSAATRPPRTAPSGRARNVIFLVSDGMNIGTLMMAHQYQLRQMGRPSAWVKAMQAKDKNVYRSLLDTRSANSMVTDSAAAGSAWGSGQRVNNGRLNITPDGKAHRTILEKAKESGRKIALVTTTGVTHATPASFAVAVDDRNAEDLIAEMYLDLKPDILLGGGTRHFDASTRQDGRDLSEAYREAGYHVFRSAGAWPTLRPGDRVLGLFQPHNLPYEIDRLNTPSLRAQVPSLSEMTRRSLAHLDTHPGGFFIQIEAARVDHAAHANDIAGTLFDQIAFDDAIQATLDFAQGRDDTLVIITTDHGTGGLQMNGRGPSYTGSDAHFDTILANTSYEGFLADFPPGELERDAFVAALTQVFPDELGADQIDQILASINADRRRGRDGSWSLGGGLRPHLQRTTGIGWTSHAHTGEFVEFTATGPGAERFQAFMLNKDVHRPLCEAMGIRV